MPYYPPPSGGGSGTVTSVTVTGANGIGVSGSPITTSGTIALTLGAITPSTVNAVTLSGSSTPTLAVTGTSAISGTNTGDQTITLTSDVTGSGTGSFATTIKSSVGLAGSPTTTTQSPADNSTKIATTAYVDNAVLGQDFKQAVNVATTSVLASYVYNNGSSGVGATITAVATGVISFDGTALTAGMRVLVKNETSTSTPNNGIYTVTVAGAIGVALILTRATDFDQSTDIDAGDSVFVISGTTQSTTTWAYNGATAPTIGTTNITFAQTAGQGSFTAGNGIAITGNSIAIDTSVTVDKTTSQVLTHKDVTDATNTFPTFNQNTTGSAATLTTGRTISITGDVTYTSPAFNGSGNVTAAGTVTALNGTSLAGLATGILKNTTTTGVPTIAAAGTDYQIPITLTTTGTSGAATFTSGTLNIPQYSGGGNVVGPASSTDSTLALFDGTTGLLLKDTGNSTSVALTYGTITTGQLRPATGAGNGQQFFVAGGDGGTSTSLGGLMRIKGGAGGATSGNAGGVTIEGGTTAGTGNGGTVTIAGGSSTGGTAGNIVLGNPGTVQIQKTGTSNNVILDVSGISAARTATFPDASGTLTLLGNASVGSGSIVLASTAPTATPTASTISEWDANKNYTANAFIPGFTTTATAAGTTTLTIASTQTQVFTGSTTQIVKLPTTSVAQGAQYNVINESTGAVTVQSSGANIVIILASGTSGTFTANTATPTTAANWIPEYLGEIISSGKSLAATASLTLAGTDGTVMTFPTTSQTIPGLSISNTWTSINSFISGGAAFRGATSGSVTVSATAIAGSNTATLQAATGTVALIPTPQTNYVATDETTASTTYANLTTSQAVTVTVGISQTVQVVFSAGLYNGPANMRLSVAVSGATTTAASDTWSLRSDTATFSLLQTMVFYFTGLTAGSNTFTLQAKTPSGTMHYFERRITAVAL